ncbi:MAG: NirD/YgiW/YdeI family stress tolerance protein [[Pasteurella] mairii]|uniref:Uncharacterized conserved protein n=1 Tax=[Pasteurella] mairii TaxID=757 RepID=A0A379B505_9PAST|nr:NirD/YgiW/YdeI family stress tolerance protein [[Pasteurella] mairii]SUB33687.1 Uncharacterized conserved protein [[Pasteurella] mairii]
MKKISLATILVLSTVSITVTAAGGFQNGNSDRSRHEMMRSGGFINANQPVTTIAQENTWKDDQYIVLQGKIVEQVGKDDYRIKDASGEMVVEIERGAWRGQDVSPNDEVKLYGEVDKSWNKTEVEIHRVEKVR